MTERNVYLEQMITYHLKEHVEILKTLTKIETSSEFLKEGLAELKENIIKSGSIISKEFKK